jgi:hypothetical protein
VRDSSRWSEALRRPPDHVIRSPAPWKGARDLFLQEIFCRIQFLPWLVTVSTHRRMTTMGISGTPSGCELLVDAIRWSEALRRPPDHVIRSPAPWKGARDLFLQEIFCRIQFLPWLVTVSTHRRMTTMGISGTPSGCELLVEAIRWSSRTPTTGYSLAPLRGAVWRQNCQCPVPASQAEIILMYDVRLNAEAIPTPTNRYRAELRLSVHLAGLFFLCLRVGPVARHQPVLAPRLDSPRRIFQRRSRLHCPNARWLHLARYHVRISSL